ncbi:NUDIX hydrolase [Nocardia mangyaensis]|uniref:NUDIX hydrolase n=1 Tax=Nocardia mangyaensis TaxID=2213200 RepID=A0A1J0W2V0_9NOCA|nr:NUDIX domain-containing protein [Nocardia mangyaensis]APE38644.1 NUDIX hydrolase [Nocardia mangyaensis]
MSESGVQARDASTVMLVRDAAEGIEVFLQRRVTGMAFAGGVTVFPGGGVDATDATADIAWAGPEPAWWAERFATDEPTAQALVAAAVRETFEECGVLLAGPTPDSVVEDSARYRAARGKLECRELSLAEFLAAENLVLRADLLRPWSNWITPEAEPRRYDTRFFVAVLPHGQDADGATSEAAHVAWRTPEQALASWRAGEHVLMPPTWSQLDALRGFADTTAVLAGERVIEPIMPKYSPGAAGHPLSDFPDNERYFAELPELGALRGR